MINNITILGRLTKSPEMRYTPAGKAVTTFTIACDRPFKNAQGERETDFVNIVAWGQTAESCAQWLSKGKMAGVNGRLQIRNYDGQDGKKVWVTEVVAHHVDFLTPRNQAESMGSEVDLEDPPF